MNIPQRYSNWICKVIAPLLLGQCHKLIVVHIATAFMKLSKQSKKENFVVFRNYQWHKICEFKHCSLLGAIFLDLKIRTYLT